jgi:hypothetical protein
VRLVGFNVWPGQGVGSWSALGFSCSNVPSCMPCFGLHGTISGVQDRKGVVPYRDEACYRISGEN